MALSIVTSFAAAAGAHAVPFAFSDISQSGSGLSIEDQFSLDVVDGGSSVSFFFLNDANTAFTPILTEIGVLDSAGLLTNPTIIDGPGVSFAQVNVNGVPQAGDHDAFEFKRSPKGGASNGIEDGQFLNLTFGLNTGFGFGDVLAGLNGGTLGFGVHIQSIDGGQPSDSDTLSVAAAAVPVPAGLPLLLGGLGAMAFARKRRRS